MTEREEVAEILETIARDGLDGPRDLDVALDAIITTLNRPLVPFAQAYRRLEYYGCPPEDTPLYAMTRDNVCYELLSWIDGQPLTVLHLRRVAEGVGT